jgi:hypothetical protein
MPCYCPEIPQSFKDFGVDLNAFINAYGFGIEKNLIYPIARYDRIVEEGKTVDWFNGGHLPTEEYMHDLTSATCEICNIIESVGIKNMPESVAIWWIKHANWDKSRKDKK